MGKSTSSQASNTSGSNKNNKGNAEKMVKKMHDHLNSDSESDFSDDDKEPKKFSIFDDPIIDPDNPVYFSMYDKVKARRSCVARRDREENERRQQEALLAKFSKLKAKKDKRKSNCSDSDSDDDDDDDEQHKKSLMESHQRIKKKHLISSSSESES